MTGKRFSNQVCLSASGWSGNGAAPNSQKINLSPGIVRPIENFIDERFEACVAVCQIRPHDLASRFFHPRYGFEPARLSCARGFAEDCWAVRA